MPPYRIAFIKYEGLTAGGTERWLQMMAANLNPSLFRVDYFYSGSGSASEANRKRYLEDHGIRTIPFKVGGRDFQTPTMIWRDTDFWDVFNEDDYDLIQTAKAGQAEYPFCLMKKPVIEYRTLPALPDPSTNTVFSIHPSQWHRTEWFLRGGSLARSAAIFIPAEPPAAQDHLRAPLNIPAEAIVAGFHQRANDAIYSPIPLAAFAQLQSDAHYFVMMGGSPLYRRQAQDLKLKNIRFIDHAPEAAAISRFLNTLDIFSHGRRDGEGFGTVLAEAMIHGKPCLSHRTPFANAQPETMGPGGLFAEDESDYVQKLELLYALPQLRAQLGKNAREHAQTYYTVQAAVNNLETIYRSQLDADFQTAPHLSYGISPLGFLYYGALENKDAVASHVITRQIPEPFGLYLARELRTKISLCLDAAGLDGLYGFEMAHTHPECRVIVLEAQAPKTAELGETIKLNRWEERITSINDWNGFSDHMRKSVELMILSGSTLHDVVKMSLIQSSNPMLLIRALDNSADLQHLSGYRFWRCFENGRLLRFNPSSPRKAPITVLALHTGQHRREIAELFRLSWTYRLQRDATRLKRGGYLLLKAARHPRRAMAGFQRYLKNPNYGWLF